MDKHQRSRSNCKAGFTVVWKYRCFSKIVKHDRYYQKLKKTQVWHWSWFNPASHSALTNWVYDCHEGPVLHVHELVILILWLNIFWLTPETILRELCHRKTKDQTCKLLMHHCRIWHVYKGVLCKWKAWNHLLSKTWPGHDRKLVTVRFNQIIPKGSKVDFEKVTGDARTLWDTFW